MFKDKHPFLLEKSRTCFIVMEHKYAASQTSYYALYEISDPIKGKSPHVICHFSPEGYEFYEFPSHEEAMRNFNSLPSLAVMGYKYEKKNYPASRIVTCGYFKPWFLANNLSQIKGDFVFPQGWDSDHKKFRTGRTFISLREPGRALVKKVTVAATRQCHQDSSALYVVFDDGDEKFLNTIDQVCYVPLDDPFWENSETMRAWHKLCNGSEFYVRIPVVFGQGYTREPNLIIELGNYEKAFDEEYSQEPLFSGLMELGVQVKLYPGDPVDEKMTRFSMNVFMQPENRLAHFTDFATILLHLFSENRCTCKIGSLDVMCPIHRDWAYQVFLQNGIY